jgi:thymidylate synthase (FAD)
MGNSYNIEVKLLAITDLTHQLEHCAEGAKNKPTEELIEYAGRLCWDTTDKLGTNPGRIQEWIRVGHESMVEHACATFYIRASRVLTHELVRHRLASYSQRSQRYVKETDPRYIEPPPIKYNKSAHKQFEEVMTTCWQAYGDLLAEGIKAEIARYVLPNACETQIICTWNFREIRHIIRLRTSERALPEMRAVASEIRRIIKEQAPKVFEDL